MMPHAHACVAPRARRSRNDTALHETQSDSRVQATPPSWSCPQPAPRQTLTRTARHSLRAPGRLDRAVGPLGEKTVSSKRRFCPTERTHYTTRLHRTRCRERHARFRRGCSSLHERHPLRSELESIGSSGSGSIRHPCSTRALLTCGTLPYEDGR